MKRRARMQSGSVRLTTAQRSVARVLVCMHDGEPTAAVEYATRTAKVRCGDTASKEDLATQLATQLQDWWRAADAETRQSYLVLDESNRAMHQAIVQARRIVVDSTLEAWVHIQNVQKGINPTPGIVMQQAVAVKRRIGVEQPANRRSSRRWLQRWRRRRGIQLRRATVKERLSVNEMHRKVIHGVAGKSTRGVGWFWVGSVLGGKKR